MNRVTIKRLDLKDIDVAKELFLLFQEEDGIELRIASNERLIELLSDENFYVTVAYVNKQLVGGLTAYKLKMYKQQASKIMLYEMAVKLSYRRKGVGNALIQKLKMFSKAENVNKFFTPTTGNNIIARNFYEATGGIDDEDIIFSYIIDNSN